MKVLERLQRYLSNQRGFDVTKLIDDKCHSINAFMREQNLNSVVIGLSGGIDSAVVYKLFELASRYPNSPLTQIVGIIAPMFDTDGITGQDEATKKALEFVTPICKMNDKCSYKEIYLGSVAHEYYEQVEAGNASKWTKGQLASIVRTPVFYYEAALLQQNGYRSIVVGTTNRDEGSYIGFYGKASDGMNDLQPIADLHKSEVREVGKVLGVPFDIIYAHPKGDVWDGRTSEQMMGTTYEFLEFYTQLLNKPTLRFLYEKYLHYMGPNDELCYYFTNKAHIEKQHNSVAHKYLVGMPCHFIDILERKVNGGWK